MKAPETTPTTSVIIPTRQGGNYLSETLESIAEQTVLPDEVIVSDDKSTDNTCKIVKDAGKQGLFDVRFFYHDPSGPSQNYLHAASHATGGIIIVGDQDDVWLPNRVELILSAFSASRDITLVSHDSILVDDELNPRRETIRGGLRKSSKLARRINQSNDSENFLFFLRGGLPFLAHTLAFRKKLLPPLLDKPEHIKDWWFEDWLTCVGACTGRIALIAESLVLYRQHREQTSGGYTVAPTEPGFSICKSKLLQRRIENLDYCRLLTSDDEKLRQIDNYLAFLRKRSTLMSVENTRFNACVSLAGMLWRGDYNRYANHILSAGSDVLRMLKKSP